MRGAEKMMFFCGAHVNNHVVGPEGLSTEA
jgi:hypothetical protein